MHEITFERSNSYTRHPRNQLGTSYPTSFDVLFDIRSLPLCLLHLPRSKVRSSNTCLSIPLFERTASFFEDFMIIPPLRTGFASEKPSAGFVRMTHISTHGHPPGRLSVPLGSCRGSSRLMSRMGLAEPQLTTVLLKDLGPCPGIPWLPEVPETS